MRKGIKPRALCLRLAGSRQISIVAWSFLFLRYAMFVDAGKAGEPEDVVLGDRVIMAIGAAWLVLFAIGVFNGH